MYNSNFNNLFCFCGQSVVLGFILLLDLQYPFENSINSHFKVSNKLQTISFMVKSSELSFKFLKDCGKWGFCLAICSLLKYKLCLSIFSDEMCIVQSHSSLDRLRFYFTCRSCEFKLRWSCSQSHWLTFLLQHLVSLLVKVTWSIEQPQAISLTLTRMSCVLNSAQYSPLVYSFMPETQEDNLQTMLFLNLSVGDWGMSFYLFIRHVLWGYV